MSYSFRYQNLGAYRLLLALLVVVSHTHSIVGPQAAESFIGPLQLGNIGVMAFFVVSGYIIASACDQLYPNRIGSFFANRFMRIYPPFLFALVVSLAVHAYLNRHELATFGHTSPQDFEQSVLSLKTFVRNLFSVFDRRVAAGTNGYYLLVPYVWAIAIELQFYLAAGLIFWASWRLPNARILQISFILVFAACLSSLFAWRWPPQLLGFAPFFLFGSAWYYFARDGRGMARPWIGAGVLLSLLLALTSYLLYTSRGSGAGAGVSSAGFALIVALFCWLTTTRPLELRARRVDAFLGDLSYPVYLNHFAIEISFGYIRSNRDWIGLLSAVVLTLLLSAAASAAVEALTRRTRDRFRGQPLVR